MAEGVEGRRKEIFALIQAVRSGSREAFEALRKLVHKPLSFVVQRCTRIPLSDAEDVVDEVVEDACSRKPRIRKRAKSWNYLIGGILRSGRRWKKRFPDHAKVSPLDADPDTSARPDRLVELRDAFRVFWASLNRECREILSLRCQGLSIGLIARKLNLSSRTVARRLDTIREKALPYFDPPRGRGRSGRGGGGVRHDDAPFFLASFSGMVLLPG